MLRTCCGCADKKSSPSRQKIEFNETTINVVNNQPATATIDKKRTSVISHVKLFEITDEDDEVFSEGVGPPIKLADNLAVKAPDGDPLPEWLIPEISVTVDPQNGLQTAVNTETALLRDLLVKECLEDEKLLELLTSKQQLFAEFLQVGQCNGGPKQEVEPVIKTYDSKCCLYDERYGTTTVASALNNASVITSSIIKPSVIHFERLLGRLEIVTSRLESVCLSGIPSPITDKSFDLDKEIKRQILNAVSDSVSVPTLVKSGATTVHNMNVQAFVDIMAGPLAQYISLSQQIGGDVAAHSLHVKNTFQAQLDFLHTAAKSAQPSDVGPLLAKTSQHLSAVQAFCEANRKSPLANNLWAVSESIPALGWVTVSPAPAPYIKEFNDAGQFYGNRVLKEWKDKDKRHVDWVRSWVQALTELQMFVKQQHTTGLVWGVKQAAGGMPPPPPPGGLPPPPPPINFDDLSIGDSTGDDRSALFAQINKGEDITKSLKKVPSDTQTNKNSTMRTGPAPFKSSTNCSVGAGASATPGGLNKPPVFQRDGKKWIIEYQKDAHNLLVEGPEMNNVVYLFKCQDSTLTVKGKLNSITLDSCNKTSVVFDTLVSGVEFINCQSVQMQVLGKVPTISIDKTDGCQVYLSPGSLDTEIISSKSSEMNVLVPSADGDYTEYPVPEQFKTTIPKGVKGGLKTITIENKG